jgi:hypothetical protein
MAQRKETGDSIPAMSQAKRYSLVDHCAPKVASRGSRYLQETCNAPDLTDPTGRVRLENLPFSRNDT